MAGARAVMRAAPVLGLSCVIGAWALPATAGAQRTPPVSPELRADAIVARAPSVQAGAGLEIPAGIYVRIGVDGAAGATWRDGATATVGRADAIARFLLDPFREVPMGLSVGGGVSVPVGAPAGARSPHLVLVIDLEGRVHHGLAPALQLGLGGGARIGLVLRRSAAQWR
jgi:hypothetical protein